MALVVEVKLTGVEGLKKSQLNRAMIRANKIIGKLFRRRFLPSRFTVAGGRRLKYTKRSGAIRLGLPSTDKKQRHKYAPRKVRILGHSRPLEASGEGKRIALHGAQTVFATRDKIRIPLPRKYNFRNPKSRISMSTEIRTVTNREAKELSGFLVKQIERELAREAGTTGVQARRVASATISNL